MKRIICNKCGRGAQEIGGWLGRNADGTWGCRPSCDAELSPDDRVLGAVAGDKAAPEGGGG